MLLLRELWHGDCSIKNKQGQICWTTLFNSSLNTCIYMQSLQNIDQCIWHCVFCEGIADLIYYVFSFYKYWKKENSCITICFANHYL